jgi:rRNA maturation protein Rpf1
LFNKQLKPSLAANPAWQCERILTAGKTLKLISLVQSSMAVRSGKGGHLERQQQEGK